MQRFLLLGAFFNRGLRSTGMRHKQRIPDSSMLGGRNGAPDGKSIANI
jgi:hypothetical protein